MRIIKIIYAVGEEKNLYWKAIKQELYHDTTFKTGNICAENQVIIITLNTCLLEWILLKFWYCLLSFPFHYKQVLLTLQRAHNHLGILFKCRFWLRRSGMRPETKLAPRSFLCYGYSDQSSWAFNYWQPGVVMPKVKKCQGFPFLFCLFH